MENHTPSRIFGTDFVGIAAPGHVADFSPGSPYHIHRLMSSPSSKLRTLSEQLRSKRNHEIHYAATNLYELTKEDSWCDIIGQDREMISIIVSHLRVAVEVPASRVSRVEWQSREQLLRVISNLVLRNPAMDVSLAAHPHLLSRLFEMAVFCCRLWEKERREDWATGSPPRSISAPHMEPRRRVSWGGKSPSERFKAKREMENTIRSCSTLAASILDQLSILSDAHSSLLGTQVHVLPIDAHMFPDGQTHVTLLWMLMLYLHHKTRFIAWDVRLSFSRILLHLSGNQATHFVLLRECEGRWMNTLLDILALDGDDESELFGNILGVLIRLAGKEGACEEDVVDALRREDARRFLLPLVNGARSRKHTIAQQSLACIRHLMRFMPIHEHLHALAKELDAPFLHSFVDAVRSQ